MDVALINADVIDTFYKWARDVDTKCGDKRRQLVRFGAFVDYLYKKDLIALPKNRDCLTMKNVRKKVKEVDCSGIKALLPTLPDLHRLWALLALNCGMNNCDIGKLTKDMVKNGILTRKRVKTEDEENVPTVSYVLWKETMELLKKFMSNHPTLWLTRKDGSAWYESKYAGEKVVHNDYISAAWSQADYGVQLKALRACPVQWMQKQGVEESTQQLYLGQSHKMTVCENNYAGSPQAKMNKVVEQLHSVYLG